MGINIDRSGKARDQASEGFSVGGIAPTGPSGQGADCNWADDDCAQNGQTGAPGMTGGIGNEGDTGFNASSFLVIEVDKFDFDVQVAANGGAGGKGGQGGNGQAGGQGGDGGAGNDCELGQHGGNGGKGGDAGQGGPGGAGGRGGKVSVLVKEAANPQSMSFNVFGGAGGLPGNPGMPGMPGAPGKTGATTGMFTTSSDCEDMGPVANWGAPGSTPGPNTRGANGADGPEPETKIVP